jgi:hypothetical protein
MQGRVNKLELCSLSFRGHALPNEVGQFRVRSRRTAERSGGIPQWRKRPDAIGAFPLRDSQKRFVRMCETIVSAIRWISPSARLAGLQALAQPTRARSAFG